MPIDHRELERLIPPLRRYARGLVGSATAADDLVQDCLTHALSSERQFRGANLSGWVFAILTNLARSAHRGTSRLPPIDPLDDAPDAGSDPAARIGILSALASLGAEQREVLLLTAIEGFTYDETAEILAIPQGTVMSRLARARDQLAARLEGASVVSLRRTR